MPKTPEGFIQRGMSFKMARIRTFFSLLAPMSAMYRASWGVIPMPRSFTIRKTFPASRSLTSSMVMG